MMLKTRTFTKSTLQAMRFASTIHSEGTPAALVKMPNEMMVQQSWSLRPFSGQKLTVPIYEFVTGTTTGKIVELDPNIYNLPLRRDIVHNVFHYFENKDRYILKKTKGFGEVAGSGKKPTA